MSILETVQRHRAERQRLRRETAIGADLIPRGSPDDPRYAGVDLVARGHDLEALCTGTARLARSLDDLPAEWKATAERIAVDLRNAGPIEIGRYATDVLYAYADIPDIAPEVETTMYAAWTLSIMLPRSPRVEVVNVPDRVSDPWHAEQASLLKVPGSGAEVA
ncbi:MAG TPA: hypothetical protein VGR08_07620 [Thermomicrobiales bacterium]|nr:hypothetical protein [Thermomicrobiales bacterium]